MRLTNLTIKDLITPDSKLTFLAGAGCSIDPPSCLPAGRAMMDAIIKYVCDESELGKILQIEELRFEALIELVRDQFDKDLKIIDYYGQCDKPNLQHYFLAQMIKKGHFVMTTNFDFLIEYALLQSNIPKEDIICIITKTDFINYSDPVKLFQVGKKTLYKIHGSASNIITEEKTKEWLVATIQAFGSNKEEMNVFQIEPFKRQLLYNISENRTLIIVGYSGSDDFDVIPTLKVLDKLKNIVWINYIFDDGGIEKVYEFDANSLHLLTELQKIDQILAEIKFMNPHIKVCRCDVNTSRMIGSLIDFDLNQHNFHISPQSWLEQQIVKPPKIEKLFLSLMIYFNFDYYDDSLRCAKNIIALTSESKTNKVKAKTLVKMGQIYKEKAIYSEALKKFNEALLIYNHIDDLEGKSTALNNIGVIHKEQGNFPLALDYFNKSLQFSRETGMLIRVISCLNNIGIIHKEQQNYQEAVNYYNEALKIANEIGDLSRKATCLNNLGNIYHMQENYYDALTHFETALKIDRELSNLSGIAIRLINLANVFQTQNHYVNALNKYKKALEILNKIGNLSEKAGCLTNIGIILDKQEKYEKALKIYKEVFNIYDSIGNLPQKAFILNNLGLIYHKTERYEMAIDQYEEAFIIAKQLNNFEWVKACLNNIASVHNNQGNYNEALKRFNEVMQIDEQLGDLSAKCTALSNIGGIYYAQGNYPEAIRRYGEALQIAEQLGDLASKAEYLNNIGMIYKAQGNYPKALKRYEEVLQILNVLGLSESPNAKNIKKDIEILKSKNPQN